MVSNQRRAFYAASGIAMALSGVPVSAQSTPATAPAASTGELAPGEIVVTAQKRPQLLSKVPLSMAAITGDSLKAAGVVTATSLQDVVPGITVDQSNGLLVTIRGVSSANGTEVGDPSAAFLVNGVYQARQQSLSGSFFDIQRVEVLRGPQGTLYGRNTTAGVINVLTNQPTDKFQAAINGELGNYGTHRVDAMLNLPVSDRLAIRGAFAYNKHDSYLIDAPGDHRKLGDDQNEYAGRLSAKLKIGAQDQGSLLLVADYSHQGGVGPQSTSLYNFYGDPFSTSNRYFNSSSEAKRTINYPFVSSGHLDDTNYGITGQFVYDFGGVALTYLGSYRIFDRNELFSLPFESSGVYPDDHLTGKTTSNSQEVRLATTGNGPLQIVGGLYYFREKTTNLHTLLPNLFGYSLYGFLQSPTIGESKAAFGQATYKLTDHIRLTGGLRYSQDTKSRVGVTIVQTDSTVLDPNLYSVVGVNDARKTFSKLTWKASIDADVTDRLFTYATVATGYKAGGFNDGCATGSPNCASPVASNLLYYKPELLTSYEAGFRAHTADNTFSISGSGFLYDYKDLQLSASLPLPSIGESTLNAGKARVTGAEIEALMRPSRNDRFDVSLAILDAHYTSYHPMTNIDFAGKKLDNSPSTVIIVGYTHTFRLPNGASIDAHADSRFSSSYYLTDYTNAIQYKNPAYTTTNLTLTYNAPSNWFIQGFLKNAENSIHLVGVPNRPFLSDPRLFGVRGGIHF